MSPPLPWLLHFRKHGNTMLAGCLKDPGLSAQFHLPRTMILSHGHCFPCRRGERLNLLNVPSAWTTWLAAPTSLGGGYHVVPGWSQESGPVQDAATTSVISDSEGNLSLWKPVSSISVASLSCLVSCKAFQGSILGTRGKLQRGQTNTYTGTSQEPPSSVDPACSSYCYTVPKTTLYSFHPSTCMFLMIIWPPVIS